MSDSIDRRAVVLGLLIAVGACAIDMYISGLAGIARDLNTGPGDWSTQHDQLFAALAVGQIIYGPLSDALGRRRPIFAGLGLFILASAAAGRILET